MRTSSWLALALLATACLPQPGPARPATPDATGGPSAATTPADAGAASPDGAPASPAPSPTAPRPPPARGTPSPSAGTTQDVLEERYRADADGNAVPDFVEEQLDLDPAADDCLLALDCPGVRTVEDLAVPDRNVLLVLDASGSMAGSDGSGATKMDAAKEAITRYVVATPDTHDLGLLVYGHVGSNADADRAASCAGIELLAPLGELRAETVDAALARFAPTGWTPIAASLTAAADAFPVTDDGENRVILVTDGIETCDGDPVAAAAALHEADIAVTVDVVGFDVSDADAEALRGIAEVTGGTYTDAGTGAELQAYFDDLFTLQLELGARAACLVDASATHTRCATDQALAAVEVLNEEVAEILADPRPTTERTTRRFALETLIGDILFAKDRYVQRFSAEYWAEVDELRRQSELARQRFQQRFGESISAATCSADGRAPAVA